MAQNQTLLDEGPIHIRPPHGQQPRRPSRHDDEVDDPYQGYESYGDQHRPPSGDGGGPDPLLENVIHGKSPSCFNSAGSDKPFHGVNLGIQYPLADHSGSTA